MNDFTKEELQILHLDMIVYSKRLEPIPESPIHADLRKKIESMIDNYCEHEWRASAIDAIYCPHCQKHVECQL